METIKFIKLGKELRNLLNFYWDLNYLNKNEEFDSNFTTKRAKERLKKIIIKVAEELNK